MPARLLMVWMVCVLLAGSLATSFTTSMHMNCVRWAQRAPPSVMAPAGAIRPAPHARKGLRHGHPGSARSCAHVCHAGKVSDLPGNLQKIVGAFQMVPDPMARYKQLLFYAAKLEALPAEDHVPENKVEGCVSQVWVKPELRDDGNVYWRADSDSQLTKGLAALLVQGLSGCPPRQIVDTDPSFIEMLGLKQSLTPSRNNGFLNMFRLMQRKSAALIAGGGDGNGDGNGEGSGSGSGGEPAGEADADGDTATAQAAAKLGGRNIVAAASISGTPIRDGIQHKLTDALSPVKLDIVDESSQHAGHAAMMAAPGKAGGSGETHFRVAVVSAEFEGMSLVKRQRKIYQLLGDEFGMGLHALSLDTKTPSEAGL